MYYGKHKKDGSWGFFLDTEYCTDFVEITDAEHSRLISEQEKGKRIGKMKIYAADARKK